MVNAFPIGAMLDVKTGLEGMAFMVAVIGVLRLSQTPLYKETK
jgi:hypothetical protein